MSSTYNDIGMLLLSLAVLDGENPLISFPVHLEDTVQGLVLKRWLSCHSTAGVSDLKHPEDDQLVPLEDLLAGVTGWHFWASRREGTPASY